MALCQFLPGPASSQVGMALGQWRVGYALLYLFALLPIAQPVAATLWQHTGLQAFAAFYQAGALVFGGGHGCCRCCTRP